LAILIWSFRLTYNWAINFHGMEYQDWRYSMYQNDYPKAWQLINFFGIHFMPTVVVFLAMVPASFVILERSGAMDMVWIIIGFIVCVTAATIQFVSDKVMKEFRQKNKGLKPRKHIDEGLWKYSRHPNYFGEVSFWWGIFFMQVGASQNIYVAFGPLVITMLFVFISIPLMEKHIVTSTPSYKSYQDQVSALIPWFRKQNKEGM
jgi:steroid 5-alpha reductase family enzyme